MSIALSGSTLYVNNEIWPYVPNSLKWDFGNPEVSVDPQVVGGGLVENVNSKDYSTAKAKIMWDSKSTSENETKLTSLIENFDQNLIKIVDPSGGSRIFENSVVINKPEVDSGSDGVFSIEIESSPMLKG